MAEATLSDIKQQLVKSVEEQQDTNDEIRNLNRKFGLWMKNQDRRLDRERLANLEMLREMKKLASNRPPIAAGAGGLFSGVSASTGIFADLISSALGAALGASLLPLLKRMARNLLKLTGIPLAIKSIKSFFGIGKDGPGFFTRIVDSFKSTFDDLIGRIKKAVSGIFDLKLGGRLGRIIAGIGGILAFFKISVPDFEVRRGTGSPMGKGGKYPEIDITPRAFPVKPGVGTGSPNTTTRGTGSPMGRGGAYPKIDTTPQGSDRARAKAELDKLDPKYGRLKKFLGVLLSGPAFLALDVIAIVSVVNSDIAEDKKIEEIGAILGGIAGGAALGAVAGALTAAWSGPLAILTSIVGAIVGGIYGEEVGRIIARYLLKNIIPNPREIESLTPSGLDELRNQLLKKESVFIPGAAIQIASVGGWENIMGLLESGSSAKLTPNIPSLLADLGQEISPRSEQGNGVRIATNENDWYKYLPKGSNRLFDSKTFGALFLPNTYTGESFGEFMEQGNTGAAGSMKPDNMTGVDRIPDDMRFKNLPPEEVAKRKYPALKRLFIFLAVLGVASLIPQIVNAANENVSDQQKIKNIAKIIGPELSGTIIALLMGNVLAALGTATGPAAPFVSPFLGVVGGAVGYYIGSNLGEQASIKLAAWALGLMKLPELVEWARHSLTGISQSTRATNLGRSVGTMMEMGAAYLGVDKKDFVNRFKVGMAAANASLKSGKGIVPAALGLGVGFLTGRAPTNIEENPYVVNEILRNSRHFLRDGAIAGYPGAGLPSVEIARIQNNRGRELYAKSAEVFDMTRAPVALAYTPVVNAPSTSVQNNQSNFVSSGFIPSFDMTYTYSPQ